jgi:hypothetical protein
MERRSICHLFAGAAVLTAAALTVPASATGGAAQGAADACRVYTGSVTADGGHTGGPTPTTPGGSTLGVFEPGKVRLSTTFTTYSHVFGADISGWVIQGDSLYERRYSRTTDDLINPDLPNELRRIGGGWTNYTALETSRYSDGTLGGERSAAYGLRSDGTLFRWKVSGTTWMRTGSAPGFASVKSMALISKTRTYDTFLANTRGGALYTIHIPATSPMRPVVKPVRTRTWQGFEKLIANKCGQYGTLLLGIDKDTKSGYLYAVGPANGTSTVIKGLGKVQSTFDDPVYFHWSINGA